MSEFYRAAIEDCKLEVVLHLEHLEEKTGLTLTIEKTELDSFFSNFEKHFDIALNNGLGTPDKESRRLWFLTRDLIKEKSREVAALAVAHAIAQRIAPYG